MDGFPTDRDLRLVSPVLIGVLPCCSRITSSDRTNQSRGATMVHNVGRIARKASAAPAATPSILIRCFLIFSKALTIQGITGKIWRQICRT
jgi:hypothetical protein